MQTHTTIIKNTSDIDKLLLTFIPQLIICFCSNTLINKNEIVKSLYQKYPDSQMLGCTTAGEINDIKVYDDTVSVSFIRFKHTELNLQLIDHKFMQTSFETGKNLIQSMYRDDLRHLFILSDGLNVNGADLLEGINLNTPKCLSISGGLAGDGDRFKETSVIYNGEFFSNKVVCLGLHGNKIKVNCGSRGGWDSFGIERKVTKSTANVVYEIDNQPALDLYKSYLGSHSDQLPSSALYFPLSLRYQEKQEPLVRTVLSIDEQAKSMTFAGNIPQNSYVRLMKANTDRLIIGAKQSAEYAFENSTNSVKIAILISCVGRRLVLKQLIEEEIEVVRDVLGEDVDIIGFYSYGEISPNNQTICSCQLHNQTMTITTISEEI